MTLGTRIRMVREEHGYRHQDFAVALRTTPATIERMERDLEPEIPIAAIETLVKLTGYLSAGDFLAKCENYGVDPARQVLIIESTPPVPSE
ncbi:MAG: helix-turn-helix transcriptional regulator [Candidatus Eremiobacterota bacterium]